MIIRMLKRCFTYSLLACFLCIFGLLCALPSHVASADDESKESMVKAAYIFNFIKFVEWPEAKSIKTQSKIDICVIGSSPIIKTSNVFEQGSSASLHISLVSEQSAKAAAAHCHILFISESESARLAEILAAAKAQHVLTISDMDKFVEHGGIVGFVTNEGKIKLEINKTAIESTGLKIDSQLLEIATRVIN